ncbi:unnamed protein product [Triticum aestivum]|uniref:Uncharacterized protein n=2 Tax=Triticum aestivum TaxID=4565 RepID=A0A9R1F0I7_WHEAT|nr:disease resistance protein RGA5-like [Triticum aestivum]KAF7019799.1 hypothetical protein CFC21_032935 [Triticum aestivum]SPT21024.1 unnamed protein product [Triticum aestivum]
MTGIMVSASTGAMNSLLGKLTTLMGEQFAKMKNLRKEVKYIRDELGSMKDALGRLADVDEPDAQTKSWRNTLRELSYDIEDIIDDFIQNIGEKDKKSGFVRKTIRRLKTSRARHRIAGQIEEIKKLVHETSDRHRRYDLDKIIPQSSNVVAIDPRVKTLYEKAANLVGMEGPKNELVDWLIDEEKQLKVVSVVGFGGLGKTTLANDVYRKLKGDFAFGAFVPVSQRPDIPNLLRSLLSQLGTHASIDACNSDLIDELRECLQTKRYLIIIDDLWDVSAWEFIKCAFPENDLASRVIVTTRSLEVATACSSPHHEYILQMKPLSNEDSRKLFFGRIFGSEDVCPNHLRDISVEILKKCGGLPLAIISIAGLLASEGPKEEEWKHVRSSLGSMSGTKLTLNGMRQILNLSYKDLPSHLKTCLLYLAMYPEDYTIKRSNLERQWLAEGFISKENGQDVEKNARNYFNELVNRSLVQPVEFDCEGAVTECKVHDMMLDLILLKCKEENFLSIVDGSEAITEEEYKVRRLSLRLNGSDNGILLGNISLSQVRSVMIFGDSGEMPPLSKFKFLRVLFVKNHSTMDLTGMNELYQLRYVMIGYRLQLPRQIRGLQQLETLDIYNASIPTDIFHLPHLSHLDIGYQGKLPDGIGNMKSLRFLRVFHLNFETNSLDNYKGLGELTNMRNLSLSGKCGDEDAGVRRMDVLCTSLRKLCKLESLYIHNMEGCMDGLSLAPYSLQRLHGRAFDWRGCWFSRVPNWTRQLHNLRELQFQVAELLDDGVGILGGLPHLVDLGLHVRRSPKQMIIIDGRGTFPVLKHFDIGLSRASYLIFQSGAMPMVQRLGLIFKMDVQKQNGAGPDGIEHLAALEEVSVRISCFKATESQKSCAESAIRSIVDRHPDNPPTLVRFYQWQFFMGD